MLTEKASVPLKELLKGLLQGVPKNRLSAEQALLKIEGKASGRLNYFIRSVCMIMKYERRGS